MSNIATATNPTDADADLEIFDWLVDLSINDRETYQQIRTLAYESIAKNEGKGRHAAELRAEALAELGIADPDLDFVDRTIQAAGVGA